MHAHWLISRRSFLATIPLCIGALAALGGCGESGSETGYLDLTGMWKQSNGDTEETWMEATISGKTITVNWEMSDGSEALYWTGSYVAPDEDTDIWSWDSENDTSKTASELLASNAESKTFTYEDGILSFEVTMLGIASLVEMKRSDITVA